MRIKLKWNLSGFVFKFFVIRFSLIFQKNFGGGGGGGAEKNPQ